ncbi:hypothetical protein MVG78_06065 [Roseomonas gilardii subsp. gilardii]|uniref:hypothetical protein n=1 Tax=Roseomonas gilardii TaxID=257708 RepID=UPI001FFB05F2|nr:hypothetical protein [Roseomonas gilardii]UPG73708.1 hypothetical protein MVG78_06065 [Roseomonas gilardii subsp. gilardii]
MAGHRDLRQVKSFVRAALECSVYVAPAAPGLTHSELLEVGQRLGYQPGEINDALSDINTYENEGPRGHLMPDFAALAFCLDFHTPQEPDFRNRQAVDFVITQMSDCARTAGRDRAAIERSVLAERAVQEGIPRHDIDVAITLMVLRNIVQLKAGLVSYPPGGSRYASPSEQRRQGGGPRDVMRRTDSARAHPVVKDVIARRGDGRPSSSEPLDAFADELERLGYGAFRLWWTQIVAELRQCSAQTSPLAATALAAALVEGALTFIVKHARGQSGGGPMGSKTFDEPPHRWRIDDLVASAAAGRDAAILDQLTRTRADSLIRFRQRIHAGRMLADFPSGPPDLRPEEARDAKATADVVVRQILDWLRRHAAT